MMADMAVRVSDVFPRERLRYEPLERRVRGELGGEVVVDSRRTWLQWEPGRVVPGWCFPPEDVRTDLLERVEPREDEHSAEVTDVFDVRAGGRVAERAAWIYADPDLEGRIAIDFYKLDRWLEEEVEVVGHPRDPFKRTDVRRSARHVRVLVDGELVADSKRPLMLFETGLPVRYYLPPEDVRMDLLEPSDKRTYCAYKGEASYRTLRGAGDIAWFYPDPLPDNAEIRDHVAFFNERADIEVDGELLERPKTQWS
jgi:uncharacterized protein (DUF427 family)